jgi:GTP-binding protein YchF
VGKSTLFNALTKTQLAEAANYPFCTIEPNVAKVAAPDDRLDQMARLVGAARTVYSQLEFVDIAGLVRGASRGQGLGNKFLSHVREMSVLLQVVRCYDNADVIHVESSVDPVRDIDIIETELMLADLQTIETRVGPLERRARAGDKDAGAAVTALARCAEALNAGRPVSSLTFEQPEHAATVRELRLLTSKPILYACNVDEDAAASGNSYTQAVDALARERGRRALRFCATLEEEASKFDSATSQLEFLQLAGLQQTSLMAVLGATAELLQLHKFYTVGEKEARSWSLRRGATAVEAAGKIHSDIARGFVRAEVMRPADLLALGSEAKVREAGKMALEGRNYVVRDGDIMHFRFA